MTPSPNVEALARILRDLGMAHGDIHGETAGMPEARALASRGVLATEALTDMDDVLKAGEAAVEEVRARIPHMPAGAVAFAVIRAALARLARGEG